MSPSKRNIPRERESFTQKNRFVFKRLQYYVCVSVFCCKRRTGQALWKWIMLALTLLSLPSGKQIPIHVFSLMLLLKCTLVPSPDPLSSTLGKELDSSGTGLLGLWDHEPTIQGD